MRNEIEIAELIKFGVKVREAGDAKRAIAIFSQAVQQANKIDNPSLVAKALAGRIICNKHLNQETGLDAYLTRMLEDILSGKILSIPEDELAVFYLRRGDMFSLENNFQEAEVEYEMAYRSVDKGSHQEPEFAGHLAQSMAANGKIDAAFELMTEALQKMRQLPNSETLEQWHRLVIDSGLHARMIDIARKKRAYYPYILTSFLKGYPRAVWLALYYGNPVRFQQYNRHIKTFLKSLDL